MKSLAPTLFCVGTNHESAGVEVRESLYLSHDELDKALPALIEKHSLQEVMVLATCNRLEIYGVLKKAEVTSDHLTSIFKDLQINAGRNPDRTDPDLDHHSYKYLGYEAASHAFSVASGLDSLVLGETQITGQFKKASQYAIETATMGPVLKRMSQECFASSKKVRTQTDISKKPVSISHAAVDLANRVYGHISDYRVLIIGAGEMAEVAAKYTLKYNPKELHVVNRTLRNAETLVGALGTGKAYGWEDLLDILPSCDIVISSTAAHDYILTAEQLKASQKRRDNKPTFLVDIALPRDIDPKCSELDDVYLFDIDDLRQVVGENYDERKKAAETGKELIKTNADYFIGWMNNLNLKPALAQFQDYLEVLFEQEQQKSLKKGPLATLSEDQKTAMERMLKSIAKKISGDAGRTIHSPPIGCFSEDLANALVNMFRTKSKPKKET